MPGLIGRKIGMTQIFKADGTHLPVTLIEAGPCPILQIKTVDKDGYAALQIGYGKRKKEKVNKPLAGHLKKAGADSVSVVKEMRIHSPGHYQVGQSIDVDIFEAGDFIDVTGISIGKGFQGGMKRWGWIGGRKSHGSMFHRRVGSIGASSFPSRVHKGKTMPGRMGAKVITIQNLEILNIDKEKHLIAVRGPVPGNENSYLVIKYARKKPKRSNGVKEEPEGAKQDNGKIEAKK